MSQLDRRQALRLFAALGAAGALAPALSACTGGADDDDNEINTANDGSPIRIGMIVPQSGGLKPYGDDMTNGFQLYLNLNGKKLGGHPVDLVIADESANAADMVGVVDKLVKQDKVIALTGVVSPDTIMAIRDKVESSQVPLIGSNASPPTLSGAKYIWRTSFVSPEPAQALGKWVADNAGGSVAIVGGDYAGDDFEVAAFLDAFKAAGGKVEGQFMVPGNSGNFAAVLNTVKASPASSMFCAFNATQAPEFVKQFRQAGFRPAFNLYGPGGLTEGYALKQLDQAANGIFTSMIYSPDLDNSSNRTFLGEYQKAYSATLPSTYAMTSYDAGTVLDKAISTIREELTGESLNAAIGRLGQIDSPRGAWQFNQNRTPLQRWYLRQVKRDGSVLSNVLTAELTTLG